MFYARGFSRTPFRRVAVVASAFKRGPPPASTPRMRHVARHRSCLHLLYRPCQHFSPNRGIDILHSRTLCSLNRLNYLQSWRLVLPKSHVRGAKSKTTVQLKDLPQGILKTDNVASEEEDEGLTYPTVVQQARNNMRKFENCVLLTRVGGFYEVHLKPSSRQKKRADASIALLRAC